MLKTIYQLLIIIGFLFANTCLCAQSTESDTIIIQLKWKHQFQFAGFYAAIEKGYYKEFGMNVKLIEGSGITNPIEEVISGRANYGLETPKLLIARNNGVPVVAMAAIFQHSPEILLTTKDKGIDDIQQLIGKKLLLSKYGIASTQAIFKKLNIPTDSMEITSDGFFRDELIKGRVDAIDDYIIDAPYLMKQAGKEPVIFKPIDYGIDFYGDILFTSEKEIKDNPKRAQQFYEATVQGWIYAMNNKKEIIQLIQENYNPTLSIDLLEYEAEQMENLLIPKLVRPGHMNIERWNHIADTYKLLGLIGPDYSLEGFLFTDYTEGTSKNLKQWTRAALIALGLTLAVLILVISFNRKLKKAVNKRTKELSEFNDNLKKEIEERKQLVRSLERSEERFKLLFDDAPISLWEEDFSLVKKDIDRLRSKGIENLDRYFERFPNEWHSICQKIKFINVNSCTLKYYKAKNKEELFEYIHKVFTKRINPTLKEGILCFSKGILLYNARSKEYTVDGLPLHVSIHVKIMAGSEHNWKRVLVSMIDITRLVKASDDLKAANIELEQAKQKAEESDKLKTAFLSNMSHEVRTPMVGVLGFLDLIKLGVASKEETNHYLNLIDENAQQLLKIINNIVDISKMEAGQVKTEQNDVHISELISNLKDVFTLKINDYDKNTDISLLCYIDKNVPSDLRLQTDETRLRQILSNLIENAIKFTTKGIIKIGVKKSDFNSDYLVFYVSDTGRGIADSEKGKIFNRFYKDDSAGGTGLGLSIVQSLVSLLGGSINVESKIGEGSTFYFTHPLNHK